MGRPGRARAEHPALAAGWQEEQDAERSACGDLIGFDSYAPFPADRAPFKEPASLADITRKDSAVRLPDAKSVGRPNAVNALSYWTYEIRYDSGIDLLVNTRLSGVPNKTVLAELEKVAEYGESYEDGRRLPFELSNVGDQVVGVARPGKLVCDCCDSSENDEEVPAQVFWRDGDMSYHLYARSEAVTVDRLVAVARTLIEPVAAAEPDLPVQAAAPPVPAAPSGAASWQWWVAGCLLAGAAALATMVVRRRTEAALSSAHVAAPEAGQPEGDEAGGDGRQPQQGSDGEVAAGQPRHVGERRDVHDRLARGRTARRTRRAARTPRAPTQPRAISRGTRPKAATTMPTIDPDGRDLHQGGGQDASRAGRRRRSARRSQSPR